MTTGARRRHARSRILSGWVAALRHVEASDRPASVLQVPWGLLAAELVAAGAVVVVELAFHVDASPLLELVVVLIDALLVCGFACWLGLRLARHPGRLVEQLYEERLNVLVVAVSLLLVALVSPRVAGAVVIARIAFATFAALLTSALGERAARLANLKPSQTTALSFVGLIAVGTLLLMTPAATVDGEGAALVDALFTFTSAVTVTGLAVHDTATYFSPFGQGVILLGIQTGAIGIMVLGAAFIIVVGGRLPQRQQMDLSQMLDVRAGETLRRLIGAVSATTLGAEALGALSLFVLWSVGYLHLPARYDDVTGALWWSVFHSVSAFCNAGFALAADSLSAFVADPIVCLVFMSLITLGGVGFAVMNDVAGKRRPWLSRPLWSWHRLELQTRVVLLMTVGLDLVGFVAVLFFEFDNALAPHSLPVKLNAALFQSVTLRTAGFNTIPLGGLAAPTIIVMIVWMFIGAGPGSTGGGVKTTTAATVFFAMRAMLRGRDDVELFGRTLPKAIVYRSISIVLIAGIALAVFLVALTATQRDVAFERLVFEAVSAMGTVGLSLGATGELDGTGRVLIALLMYFGRLGPLTVALAVGERVAPRGFKYPEGRMAVG